MLEWQEKPGHQTGCLGDCFTLEAAGGAIHTTRPERTFVPCGKNGCNRTLLPPLGTLRQGVRTIVSTLCLLVPQG